MVHFQFFRLIIHSLIIMLLSIMPTTLLSMHAMHQHPRQKRSISLPKIKEAYDISQDNISIKNSHTRQLIMIENKEEKEIPISPREVKLNPEKIEKQLIEQIQEINDILQQFMVHIAQQEKGSILDVSVEKQQKKSRVRKLLRVLSKDNLYFMQKKYHYDKQVDEEPLEQKLNLFREKMNQLLKDLNAIFEATTLHAFNFIGRDKSVRLLIKNLTLLREVENSWAQSTFCRYFTLLEDKLGLFETLFENQTNT